MSDDVVYLIVCGATQLELGQAAGEQDATDLALEHDRYHHCSPWIQYPLEHIHRPVHSDLLHPSKPE
jgi:hypothetical protein